MPQHLSNHRTRDSTPFFGIDVGARLLHLVALDRHGRVEAVEVRDTGDLAGVADALAAASATGAAIDAPTAWSTAPHAADGDLSPKFRSARCGEIGLGRAHRVWVPWTTPVDPADAPAWMHVGVGLARELRRRGIEPIETYPYAAFRVLNRGAPLPPKRSPAGRGLRQALLAQAGVAMTEKLGRSHDALDAAAAALVALHRGCGTGFPATCGHDGSAIWLPAASPAGVAESSRPPL